MKINTAEKIESYRYIGEQSGLDPFLHSNRKLKEVLAKPLMVPEGEDWVVEMVALSVYSRSSTTGGRRRRRRRR